MLIISDFHSHILPGMDDGSPDAATSVAMLREEAAQGVAHVVLTPHFYPQKESPRDFLRRRDAAVAELLRATAGEQGLPRLTVGAEVAYYGGMSQSEELPLLTIDGTNSILVEMPPAPWPKSVWRELQEIRDERGLTPIVAHVDRYISPLRTYGIPRRLKQLGLPVQANGNFFLRRETAGMALRLLKADRIHLIGSDCHNLTTRRPNLAAASERIEQKLGRKTLFRISAREYRILNDLEWNGVI